MTRERQATTFAAITTYALVMTVFAVSGCTPHDRGEPYYFLDLRTNLCFYGNPQGRFMTNVPCNPEVMRQIMNASDGRDAQG